MYVFGGFASRQVALNSIEWLRFDGLSGMPLGKRWESCTPEPLIDVRSLPLMVPLKGEQCLVIGPGQTNIESRAVLLQMSAKDEPKVVR